MIGDCGLWFVDYLRKRTQAGALRGRAERVSSELLTPETTEISFDLWFATRKYLPEPATAKLRGQLPPHVL
jgi:hypothetical protein